ncbi:hypothetical protein [Serinibacter salmoneus]|uniref:Uncharacterized protein n=1 Tax=Serinibacter salmoneus TaxID=556530 RepID=A0A2A9CYQ5_9MICO|nr:hypothetical protein [Serinibacter salmoneus]PFG19567.1 hypothetical protein ATL40_1131 [Serinibacter salmoneus]
MPQTVLVLTEHALSDRDIANIEAVSPSEDVRYRLIVPTETSRSVVLQVIDSLALLDLREAWDSMTGERSGHDPAEAVLTASREAMEAAGLEVAAGVVADDPIATLREESESAGDVLQVLTVTDPHAFEDTVHRSWADRAQDALGLPVLHMYAGTSRLGT